MVGGSGFDSTAVRQAQAPSTSRGARRRPATIDRVIAVTPLEKQRDAGKNRSHNPKTTDTKLQSFFFD